MVAVLNESAADALASAADSLIDNYLRALTLDFKQKQALRAITQIFQTFFFSCYSLNS